jgi:NitT/TauT family transport system substrate-binding protein
MKRRGIARKLALLALVPAVAIGIGQSAFALESVRILIPVRSIDEAFSPFVVAKEKGYFAQEGYDVTLIPVAGSNEAAIQISAGNAEVGAASPGEALVGIQSGKLNIKYFYDLYYANIWSVAVMPDSPIKALADVKGKKVGVQSMGSAGVTYGRAFANAAGLDPQTDVSFLPIGIGAQAITSVQRNLVDAVVYWDAALAKMRFSGLKLRTVPAPESLSTLPDVGMLARPELIDKNPKMLVGIARAVAKGYDYSMANPEAAVLLTWKFDPATRSKNPDAAKALQEGVTVNQGRLAIWNSAKIKEKHGLFIKSDWERLLQFLVDQKVLPAKPPVDNVVTNVLIDQINSYDRGKIIAEAKKEDLSALK